MSTFQNAMAPNGAAPQAAPPVTAWNTVASYATYAEAQQAIDQLATVAFPVGELEIVGSGLRSVERVTGRMTLNRAVASGAGSGAWFGVFVGLLVGLFAGGAVWLGLLAGGFLIGAAWGALLALGLRWTSRGHHNFSSLHAIVATQYDVIALDGMAEQARSALGVAQRPTATRRASTG